MSCCFGSTVLLLVQLMEFCGGVPSRETLCGWFGRSSTSSRLGNGLNLMEVYATVFAGFFLKTGLEWFQLRVLALVTWGVMFHRVVLVVVAACLTC